MTAWTILVILLCIMTQCSIDFIGLEYSSVNQCLTDVQFRCVAFVCIFFSFCVDVVNAIGSKRHKKRRDKCD